MKKMTERDIETYKFVCEHCKEWNGKFPTIRTIMSFTGHVSTSSVSYTLRKLEEFGLLRQVRMPTEKFYMVLGGQKEELFVIPDVYRAIKFYDEQLSEILA